MMNMIMLSGMVFFTVTLLVYALFALRADRVGRIKSRLSQVIGDGPGSQGQVVNLSRWGQVGSGAATDEEEEEKEPHVLKRVTAQAWAKFRRTLNRLIEDRKEAKIEMALLRAGRPFNMTPVDYRIMQFITMVGFPALMTLYGLLLKASFGAHVLLVLVGTTIGSVLPGYYLKLKTKARCQQALKELPDVLDLLTVSLEAGLGFDAALSKLISKKEGVLSTEFRRCLEEIRLGKTRREALTGLRDRVELDELKVLISSILQAEKLGIGMVQVLRVQSAEVREQRKQRAEEAAMKAPIKMLFPLVLFIFPSLFIVLLGPAALQFIDVF